MKMDTNEPETAPADPLAELREFSETFTTTPGRATTKDVEPARIIICPETGAEIREDDIDGLINLVVRAKRIKSEADEAEYRARQALAKLAPESESKTRRVQGRHAVAILEFPSTGFNQSVLKEIWNAFPHLRDQVLRIEAVGVKRTEWKKLQSTTGHPDLETVKKMLSAAEFETHRAPTVKVEDLV